uniref:C3H1-type domain-containing protein n=1 Tax=Brassica campestris TaxID=3711 RepID=M4EU44_BRACM
MGDGARESKRQARRRESRSMEETKERNPDLRPRKSDVRTERRHDHKESYTDIKRLTSHETDKIDEKRQRDVEKLEIEAEEISEEQRLKVEKNGGRLVRDLSQERNMDLRSSKSDVRTHRRHKRDPRICAEKRFFRRGFCKDGSDCKFIHAKNNEALRLPNTMRQPLSHPKDRDGADTMRQGSGRHETESAYRPEEKKYNDPQEQRDNTEWQRGEAQENVHEHRQRDITDCQRYYEMGRRDAQEIVVKQHRQRDITESLRYFEMGRRDAQVIVQQHRQREASGRQRYLEEEKSEEAQENDQEQRLMVTTLDGRFDERRHETESSSMAEKRFFRRGFCKDGSDCKFIHAKNNEALRLPNTMRQPLSHPKDRDGADTMRQGSGRHETESAYRPEEKKYNDPQEQRDNTEWQRGEAQENVHEHRQRDITDCQRYYEMGRRDAQEIVVKQHRQRDITESLRYFEMGRRDAQVIVQQHRQREASGRQRYLEEEKSEEAQENDQEQRLMVTTLDGRFDERRHETESSSMAEKREELFTSLQSVFKDVIDDIAAGYERVGTEHGEGNVGRQRVEAEEIVQEQSNRDGDVL